MPMHTTATAVYDVQVRLNERFKSLQEAEGNKCLSSLFSQTNQHVEALNGAVIPENGMGGRKGCKRSFVNYTIICISQALFL